MKMARSIFIDIKILNILIALLLLFSSFGTSNGRHWRQLSGRDEIVSVFKNKEKGGISAPATQGGKYSSTFNVLDYGAKGDGHSDDTKVITLHFDPMFHVCLTMHVYVYAYIDICIMYLYVNACSSTCIIIHAPEIMTECHELLHFATAYLLVEVEVRI